MMFEIGLNNYAPLQELNGHNALQTCKYINHETYKNVTNKAELEKDNIKQILARCL